MAELDRIKRNVGRMVAAGAPEEEIDAYIDSEGVSLEDVRSTPLNDKSIMQSIADFTARASDELLMGWGPKYRAGMKSVLPESFGGTGEDYETNLAAERARQQRYDEESPWLSAGARTIGLGTQMAAGAGLATAAGAAPAATSAGRIGQTAGAGAITGAAYGSGEAETGDEAFDGMLGMALGGAAGAVGGAAIEGASAALTRRGMSAADKASMRLAKALADDKVSPGAAGERIRTAREAGSSDFAMIDAAGENTRSLGRTLRNLGGEAGEQISDFSYGRMAGQYDRFANAVAKNINRNVSIDDLSDAMSARAKQLAGPIYKNVGQERVALSRQIKQRLSSSPSMKGAFDRAQQIAGEFGDTLDPIFVNGKFNPKIEEVSAKTLHYLRQGLDDFVSAETKMNPNGTTDVSKLGAALTGTRKEIDSFLKKSAPSIREADKIYSAYGKAARALKAGPKFESLTPEQLASKLSKMDPKERAMYRLGAAWQIHKKLGQIRDARDIAKVFMASPNDRKRMRVILGGEKSLKNLKNFTGAERSISKTATTVSGNSTTPKQLEDMANFKAEKVGDAIRQGPFSTFKNWLADTWEKSAGISQSEKRALADLLTDTSEESTPEVVGAITKGAERLSASKSRALKDIAGGLATGEAARERFTRPSGPLELTVTPRDIRR